MLIMRTKPLSQVCVGYPADGQDERRVWFTRLFLDQGYCEAPAVIWQRDDRIITRTYKPDWKPGEPHPPPMIWKLTDQRDIHGRRLGVWPD